MSFDDLREWLWPLLERLKPEEVASQKRQLDRHLAAIDEQAWTTHTDVALEESRRIFDAEMTRRASADTKATTYMAVIAALVPIAFSVQSAIVEGKIGSAPSWINLAILATGTIYVISAGLWAFKVLRVSASARTDVPDVVRAWTKRDPRVHAVRATLKAARLNWSGVNEKINFIRMAHEYLMRAFVTFSLLLIVNAAWTLVTNAAAAIRPPPTRVVKVRPEPRPKRVGYAPASDRALHPPRPAATPTPKGSDPTPSPGLATRSAAATMKVGE